MKLEWHKRKLQGSWRAEDGGDSSHNSYAGYIYTVKMHDNSVSSILDTDVRSFGALMLFFQSHPYC